MRLLVVFFCCERIIYMIDLCWWVEWARSIVTEEWESVRFVMHCRLCDEVYMPTYCFKDYQNQLSLTNKYSFSFSTLMMTMISIHFLTYGWLDLVEVTNPLDHYYLANQCLDTRWNWYSPLIFKLLNSVSTSLLAMEEICMCLRNKGVLFYINTLG